jgi:polar amino acid transport system permease protein
MDGWFGFQVIWDNIEHFLMGRYPHGPIGGLALTIWLAVVSCTLSILIGIFAGLLCVSQNRFIGTRCRPS